jgi:hypothetical protein
LQRGIGTNAHLAPKKRKPGSPEIASGRSKSVNQSIIHMDTSIATASLQNFWFGGRAYRITQAGIRNEKAYASVEPSNDQLKAKLIQQLVENQNISYTTAQGYTLFSDERQAFDKWASEQRRRPE